MGGKLAYLKQEHILSLDSDEWFIGDPSEILGHKYTLPPVSKNEVQITSILTPYFAVHEVYITLESKPVVCWKKGKEPFSIRSGHALILDQKAFKSWSSSDYNRICQADFEDSAGLRTIQSGDFVYSFSMGNWNWHPYFGFDESGALVKIAFPFEKDLSWYENEFDHDKELFETNKKLATCNEPFVVEFISMNMEDIEKTGGIVIFRYEDAEEAFRAAYHTDWKTTKLHLKSITWNGFEFGENFVEEWCNRNHIEMPEFLKERIKQFYEEHS